MPSNPKNKVLWLITARAGSKAIPHKNIKLLGGKPLLSYRIREALAIADKKDVWISTDSNAYAAIAKSFGATVHFLRPKFLATDRSKSVDVVLHAMRWAQKLGVVYEAIGLLEPTAPFVNAGHLREAAQRLFSDPKAKSIVATRQVRPSTFYVQENTRFLSKLANRLAQKSILRRQDEKKEITPSGGFYIAKWDSFLRLKTFYSSQTLSYLLPDANGLEIDEPLDWLWAKFLLAQRIVSLKDLFKVSSR